VRGPLNPEAADSEPQSSSAESRSSYHVGSGFVVEHTKASPSSPSRLSLWSASAFDPGQAEALARPADEPNLSYISPMVSKILGVVGPSTIVFLDVDLWVCSADLQSVRAPASEPPLWHRNFDRGAKSQSVSSLPISLPWHSALPQARRHFFALNEWRTTEGEVSGTVISSYATLPARSSSWKRDAVAFSNKQGIVVVQGGLEFSEDVAVSALGAGVTGGG